MKKIKKIGSLIGFTILASGAIAAIPFISTSCGNGGQTDVKQVMFQKAVVNGTTNEETSTVLELEFSARMGDAFTKSNITFSISNGVVPNVGQITETNYSYNVALDGDNWIEGAVLTIQVSSPEGYSIAPNFKTVTLHHAYPIHFTATAAVTSSTDGYSNGVDITISGTDVTTLLSSGIAAFELTDSNGNEISIDGNPTIVNGKIHLVIPTTGYAAGDGSLTWVLGDYYVCDSSYPITVSNLNPQ